MTEQEALTILKALKKLSKSIDRLHESTKGALASIKNE